MPIFEYKCSKCGHKMEFLEKKGSKISTPAKSVEAWILKNCYQPPLLGKVATETILPPLERARPERVDCDRKDCL